MGFDESNESKKRQAIKEFWACLAKELQHAVEVWKKQHPNLQWEHKLLDDNHFRVSHKFMQHRPEARIVEASLDCKYQGEDSGDVIVEMVENSLERREHFQIFAKDDDEAFLQRKHGTEQLPAKGAAGSILMPFLNRYGK